MGKDLRTAKLATRLRLGLGKRPAANRLVKAKAARKSRDERGGPAGSSADPACLAPSTVDPGAVARATVPQRPHVDYDVERAAYFRRKPELLRTIPGKFVVFVGEEMAGPFDDSPTAISAGLRRFGWGPLYVKQILVEEPYAEIGTVIDSCRS